MPTRTPLPSLTPVAPVTPVAPAHARPRRYDLPTEVGPRPSPLRSGGGYAQGVSQTPAPHLVLDVTPQAPPRQRAAMARRERHQEHMDTIAEARAVVWLIFGVLCCLVLVVLGTLIVGAMLGGWHVPMH
jgi:hypothetical protein